MGMETSFTSVGVYALLGLGLVFGLKHATEVDHIVAVSTIVSERRSVLRSALVGGLWGGLARDRWRACPDLSHCYSTACG